MNKFEIINFVEELFIIFIIILVWGEKAEKSEILRYWNFTSEFIFVNRKPEAFSPFCNFLPL